MSGETQVNTDICPDCGGAIHALPPCGAPHHAGCACSVAQREAEIRCLRMQRNAARTERDRLDRILRLTTAAAMGLDDYKERSALLLVAEAAERRVNSEPPCPCGEMAPGPCCEPCAADRELRAALDAWRATS